MKLKYFLGVFAFALGATMLTSCDDDEYDVVGNPDNLVYVNIAHDYPANMPKNTYAYTLYQTPVGPIVASEPGNIELYVYDTKKAGKDITATLELAPDVEVPGCAKFPENSGIVVTLSENTVTIPAGSNRSNSVMVNVDVTNANWELFTESAYVLPIKVIASSDGGKVSQDMNMAYIGVNVDKKDGMLNPDANSPVGTKITDTEGWTVSYSVPATGRGGECDTDVLFDDNQWSYAFFVANHADKVNEEVIVTVDMGKEHNINSCLFRYYYNWYTIKDGTIYTSLDGVEYTEQGTLNFSSNGINRYFVFWAPMKTRYIRLVSHSFYGGTGEGTAFSDFIAYE